MKILEIEKWKKQKIKLYIEDNDSGFDWTY